MDISNDVQFKRVSLDTLTPNLRNYNQHPPAQIADLKASLIRYKQVKPVVVQQVAGGEDQYILLAGHGITEAAKELYVSDPKKYAHLNNWAIAIAPSSWSIMDAKGYMVSDNELSKKAESDETMLAQLLQEQQAAGYDLASLGTDDEGLRQMLAVLGDEYLDSGEEKDDDEFDVTPDDGPTRTQLGDIWQLGKHKILCGDSRDPQLLRRLIGNEEVSFVWSDPPYGISIVKSNGHIGSGSNYADIDGKHATFTPNKYAFVLGDESPDTAIASFKTCNELWPKALQIWWGANHYSVGLPSSSCWIVWDKENDATDFADCELAWCSHAGAVRIFRHKWNGMVRASEQGIRRVHPNQKPIAMCLWSYERFGKEGDVIFDPFLGSGISIIAAERMGNRAVIGCELSPAYCDVVLRRWEAESGREAVLIERIEEHSHA